MPTAGPRSAWAFTRAVPESACSSPTMMRASVVLPEPDSPTMPMDSPGATLRETSLRATRVSLRERNTLVRSRTLTTASAPTRGSCPARGLGPSIRGSASASRFVYSWRGDTSTSFIGPSSTIWPSFMTMTSSPNCRASARSWVTSTSVMPRSSRRRVSSVRMSRCVVTSRAVVGSSAMSTPGSESRAAAMATR